MVTLLGDNRVMVTFPPGEVALFTAHEVERFRDVLRAAALRACGVLPLGTATTPGGLPSRFAASVPCRDAVRRRRVVTVTAGEGTRITVAAPAAGVAVLSPLEIGGLRGVLRDAHDIAVLRGADAATGRVTRPAPPAVDRLRVAV